MNYNKYCAFLLFATLGVTAQNTLSDTGVNHKALFFTTKDMVAEAKGSPYITTAYLPVKVPGFEGGVPPMRYNAEKDEMEFMKGSEKYYLAKSENLEVEFADKKYKYLTFVSKKGAEDGYLIELVPGKYALYKKEKVVFVPKTESANGYDKPKPAEYRREEDKLYFGTSNNIGALPKKKELLAMEPKHATEIENFIKTNKLSLGDEKDLMQLFKYMNSLN